MKRWMKNCLLCAVAAAAVALLVFTGLQSASLAAVPDRGAITGENPPALPSDGEEAVGEVTLPDGAAPADAGQSAGGMTPPSGGGMTPPSGDFPGGNAPSDRPDGATSRAWLFPVGAAAAAILGFCVAEAVFSRMNRVSPFPARREKHPTEKEGEAA